MKIEYFMIGFICETSCPNGSGGLDGAIANVGSSWCKKNCSHYVRRYIKNGKKFLECSFKNEKD